MGMRQDRIGLSKPISLKSWVLFKIALSGREIWRKSRFVLIDRKYISGDWKEFCACKNLRRPLPCTAGSSRAEGAFSSDGALPKLFSYDSTTYRRRRTGRGQDLAKIPIFGLHVEISNRGGFGKPKGDPWRSDTIESDYPNRFRRNRGYFLKIALSGREMSENPDMC